MNLSRWRIPSEISRCPRNLGDLEYFKGNELDALVFYGDIILDGIQEENFLAHFNLLGKALFLAREECISNLDLILMRRLLIQFVEQAELLYGSENMRFNIHQLVHLADCVEKYGPLTI